jgi:hypothetical protein
MKSPFLWYVIFIPHAHFVFSFGLFTFILRSQSIKSIISFRFPCSFFYYHIFTFSHSHPVIFPLFIFSPRQHQPSDGGGRYFPIYNYLVLRIQTILIPIRIRLFDTDPDPYRFKEVMYLNGTFFYILTWFSLSLGPPGTNQQTYVVEFSLGLIVLCSLE